MLGVFRSVDGGDTWEKISKSHFADEDQISYNNTIAVHPKEPYYVICGGVDLHRPKMAERPGGESRAGTLTAATSHITLTQIIMRS